MMTRQRLIELLERGGKRFTPQGDGVLVRVRAGGAEYHLELRPSGTGVRCAGSLARNLLVPDPEDEGQPRRAFRQYAREAGAILDAPLVKDRGGLAVVLDRPDAADPGVLEICLAAVVRSLEAVAPIRKLIDPAVASAYLHDCTQDQDQMEDDR